MSRKMWFMKFFILNELNTLKIHISSKTFTIRNKTLVKPLLYVTKLEYWNSYLFLKTPY